MLNWFLVYILENKKEERGKEQLVLSSVLLRSLIHSSVSGILTKKKDCTHSKCLQFLQECPNSQKMPGVILPFPLHTCLSVLLLGNRKMSMCESRGKMLQTTRLPKRQREEAVRIRSSWKSWLNQERQRKLHPYRKRKI